MADEHPFHMLFETFGRTPLAHADSVNREANDQLVEWLDVPTSREGGCILLRAPRAGHGKTHLLSRVRHRFSSTHEAILLRASRGYQIDATTVLEDVVRHLLDEQPGHLGLTRMDVLARRTMAAALIPLVESGEVPSQDRHSAVEALRRDPLGTFDFHNPSAVTAQWAKESFAALSERLLPHLSRSCGLPGREINFWLQALYHHSSAPLEDHRRHQIMEDKARANAAGDAGMMNRLEALLALMCLGKRVVLIADDLEGFSSDSAAALNLSTLVMALRQSVPRLDVIVSLNQDVWEEVFVPCLSDGLVDRLSERLIELRALNEADMIDLINSRAPGKGHSILDSIDLDKAGTHARGLIREAGKVWQQAEPKDQVTDPKAIEPAVSEPVKELRQMPAMEIKKPEPEPSPAGDRKGAQAHQPEPEPSPAGDRKEAQAHQPEPEPEPEPSPAGDRKGAQAHQPEPEPSPAGDRKEAQAHQPEPRAQTMEPIPVEWEKVSAESAPVAQAPETESEVTAEVDEWESDPVPADPDDQAASEETAEEESRIEDPVGSLDSQDRARIEDLLAQFRKKFGQGGD